jgi:hypothetical protein
MRGQHLTRFVLLFCFHLIPQFSQRCAFRTAKETRRKASISNRTPSRERICCARRDPQVQHATHNTAKVASARPTSLRTVRGPQRHWIAFLYHGVS